MESDFEKNNKEYPFTLLREEADERDAFKNHTHENIADALSVLVEKERGGLTVGVEGPWGGGKSTVLKILRRKLTKSYFFFFDAWAHEGDSLRRVFLESLCGYFKGELKDDGDVSAELDALEREIDGRKVVTTTSSTRKPTLMGILSVVSASAAALGVGILSVSRDANNQFCPWMLGVSIAFLSCPAVLVVGRFFYLTYQRLFGALKKFWTVDNWTFLQDSSIEETTRDVTEEDERSSVEFERFFAKIMERVLSLDKGKQLVIAIDNLDRINPEDSFRLWSTLQTFLQRRSVGVGNGDWFNRLWILVPYDTEGLSKLWSRGESNPEMVKSFMDKCFQIRIEVPRPLMSDWEFFAKTKIEESLGRWSIEDKKVVFEILRSTRAGVLDIPTPREIKNYINQVAVIRNHARQGISTSVIAYYVLSRYQECHTVDRRDRKCVPMSVEEVREALLWDKYPEFEHRGYLGDNYTAMFAGLIFGVDATSGHELLIGSEIEESLKTGDGQSLKKLESIHQDGFWNVLDDFLRKQMRFVDSDSSLAEFFNRCCALFRAEFDMAKMGEVCRYVHDIVKSIVNSKIESLRFSLPENVELYDAASDTLRLLYRFGDSSLMQKLYAVTIELLNLRLQKKDAPLPKGYGLGVEKLLAAYPEQFRKPRDVSGLTFARLVEFVPGFNLQGSFSSDVLRPDAKSYVADFVKSVMPNSEISPNLPIMTSFVIRRELSCDWTPVVSRCLECIFYNNGFASHKVPATCILEVLIQIVVADEKKIEQVRPILDDWRFYNFVGHDVAVRSVKAALLSLIVSSENVLVHNNIPLHTNETNQGMTAVADIFRSDKEEVALKLLSEAGRFDAKQYLWNICGVKEAKVFDHLIALSMMDETDNTFLNYYYGDMYVDEFLRRTGKIGTADAGMVAKELVAYLSKHCGLWSDIEKNALTEESILKRSASLAAIVDTGLCPRETLEKIGKFLSEISADVLVKMLVEGEILLLLQALRRSDADFRMKHEYYKMLGYIWDVDKESDYQKIRGGMTKGMEFEKWKVLVGFCPTSMRDQLSDDLLSDFKKMNVDFRQAAYPFLKEDLVKRLADAGYWEKEAWEALKSSSADVLKMYADIMTICKERMDWKLESRSKQKFKEAIHSRYASAVEADAKEALKQLADIIGVAIAETEEGEKNSSVIVESAG